MDRKLYLLIQNKSVLLEAFTGDSELDLLAQTTSPQLALLLLEHFPGLELKLPTEVPTDHHVARKLGHDYASALATYLSGSMIYIPKRHPAVSAALSLLVKELIGAGEPRHEIARTLGITQRHLRRITAKLGLSGVSCASHTVKRLPNCPQSHSNGGLTGVSENFAPLSPLNASSASERTIQTKFGIYVPQSPKG